MSNQLTHDDVYQLNRKTLFDALAAEGIITITVEFDGGGDEGQIQSVEVLPYDKQGVLKHEITLLKAESRGWRTPITDVLSKPPEDEAFPSIESALESLCYDLLERDNAGWENNEGCWGAFTLDVTDRVIELDMNVRIVTSDGRGYEY